MNKKKLELSEKAVHSLALEILRNKYEDEMYAQIGFREINDENEKQQLIQELKEAEQAKCKSSVNAWLKEKNAIEREVKKLQVHERKQKAVVEKEKRKKVKKNIHKWQKGLSRREKRRKQVEAKNKLFCAKRPEWIGLGEEIEVKWNI
mmetsp:Transcript_4902/g.6387  ORF Transcript_4902/g.6387 Transcript_4902/m.6387 type:complete len:148 (+) Transcript_4902:20-463(+)